MLEPLLTHQVEFYNELKKTLEEENFLCIIGKSGIGKSFLLEKLRDEYILDGYTILLFSGDKLNQYRPYFPFHRVFSSENLLHSIKEFPIELSKDIPHIGSLVSLLLEKLINRESDNLQRKYPYLNNEEKNIISKLKYLTKNPKVLFIYDNFQWWDKQSIELLNTIISSGNEFDFIHNCKNIYVFTDTNSNTSDNEMFRFFKENFVPQLNLKEMTYQQFLNDKRQLGFYNHLDEKQLHFIYRLANGNIYLFKQLANEFPDNASPIREDEISGIQYLNDLLEKRMKELGATGKQIMYVLEFGSVIGLSFSCYELEQATQIKKGQFIQIITHAKEWNLLEDDREQNYYKFVHDIILEIFKHRTENNIFEYYEKLEECLRIIKPGSYLRRGRYCVYMRDLSKAILRYLMELFQEIRDNNSVYTEVENEALGLMDNDIRGYYFSMKKAYKLYLEKRYDEAIVTLDKIPLNLNKLLLAERDLLKSRCLSKSLNKISRQEAINLLEKYYEDNLVKYEIDLWERLMTSLVTAYYHGSFKNKAQKLEEEIFSSLSQRNRFDSIANLRIHILLRNSSSIHDSEFAEGFIKKSVDYFGQNRSYGIPINILEYYKALLNYSATLCKNGRFKESYQYAKNAIKLETDFQDINFPRSQIIFNNYVISGFLSNEIQLADGIPILKSIVNNLPPIAERIFYISNLCIFYILNNNLDIAQSHLDQEMQYYLIDEDLEGSYKYKIYLDYAIIAYLRGNYDIAKTYLDSSRNPIQALTDNSYLKKKIELFFELIDCEERERIITPNHLDICLLEKVPHFQNSVWDFLGRVFPYSILSNWDI